MKNLLNGFLLALCAGIASPAMAQSPSSPANPALANPALANPALANPAVAAPVSQTEFVSRRTAGLRQADANADGQVTPEEMATFRRTRAETQRVKRLEDSFARLDANADGHLSREEFLDRSKMTREGARSRQAGSRQAGSRHVGHGYAARRNVRRTPVAPRVINIAEVEQKARENFAAIDGNNDGVLTPQERRVHRRATMEARREQRMQRRAVPASPSAPVSE